MALEDKLHASLGMYMGAPAWVRSLGGRIYRAIPTGLKHGARHAGFLRDARMCAGNVGWEEVSKRLEQSLQAAACVPAYAEHAASMRDCRREPLQRLRALPLQTKTALKAHLPQHLNPSIPPRHRLQMFTGGSTSQPLLFYLHRHVSRPKENAYIQHIERSLLSAEPGDWTLSLRGRTVDSAARPSGQLWTAEPIKRHYLFSSDHLEARFMPSYAQALTQLRPRTIHAFPSALYPLARWLQEHPERAYAQQVTGILLTSENIYDFQLALFKQVFPNARIVQHYGHSERVLMAVATGLRSEAEFFPLYGLPELVDAQGQVIDRPGVLGEIVGTSFDNHVMPFIRYRTGDMGMWAQAPRYHGTSRFVMQRIEGRCQEFVVCADQRLVSITTLGAAHFHELSRVDWIQFEQHVPGLITLKVVKAAGLDVAERARIAEAVREKTQGGCDVEVQAVASIERTERGKHRMLIQHLDLSDYLGAAITPQREDRLLADADDGDLPMLPHGMHMATNVLAP